jgi:hypothetical protein
MGADTREHLLPGQRTLQEPDLHFSAVGELRARFQEHHIIFHHPFTDHDLLPSSYHQIRWTQAYNLVQISAMRFLVVLGYHHFPPTRGNPYEVYETSRHLTDPPSRSALKQR